MVLFLCLIALTSMEKLLNNLGTDCKPPPIPGVNCPWAFIGLAFIDEWLNKLLDFMDDLAQRQRIPFFIKFGNCMKQHTCFLKGPWPYKGVQLLFVLGRKSCLLHLHI